MVSTETKYTRVFVFQLTFIFRECFRLIGQFEFVVHQFQYTIHHLDEVHKNNEVGMKEHT